MILSCKGIKKTFVIDTVLTNITFHLNAYDKAALVGINGAGKTTLMRILTKDLSPDEGLVTLHNQATLGYLAQEQNLNSDVSIYEEMLTVYKEVFKLEEEMRDVESKMHGAKGDALTKLMEEYATLQHAFDQKDGYGYESQIKGVLKGLGFKEEEFSQSINTLSGGQKSRVSLAKLLLSKPDVLLLDEPTNHLDIEAVTWLEDFLRNYRGTILIISHDRYFLDKIVNKIIEIERGASHLYIGNYSHYASQKAIDRDVAARHYENQQREIKRQEAIITQLRSFNQEKFIKRAKSREKALEKVEIVDKPIHLNDEMRLAFQPKIVSGQDVLHTEGLSKSFDQKTLFEDLAFDIKKGDKIALVGANGIGKTTLFRIIMKELASDTGRVDYGSRVKVGYYDQQQENLNTANTVFEEIQNTYPKMNNGQVRNTLAAFLFTGDDVFKDISTLSGGEKARVSLAKIMLSESNFLLLDEPTNHLDIVSREVLENTLSQYEGTLFFISHDRYFINKVATKVFEMTPEKMSIFLGNYNDYLDKKALLEKIRLEKEAEAAEKNKSNTVVPSAPSNVTDNKANWLKQKELTSKIKKLETALGKCEEAISQLEEKIEEIDAALCLEENYTDAGKAAALHNEKLETETKLEEAYEEWENISGELNELNE